jgi:hypothetical protein
VGTHDKRRDREGARSAMMDTVTCMHDKDYTVVETDLKSRLERTVAKLTNYLRYLTFLTEEHQKDT